MGHPEDPGEPKLRRNRHGDEHRDNCGSKGYVREGTYSNIHHLVCISCMADGTIEMKVNDAARFEFIKKCLAETNWNINAKDNVVGLPKKQAYVDKTSQPPNWDGWACHQVDHDRYLERVSARLNTEIWATLQERAKDCKHGGEIIAGQLEGESGFWEGELGGRTTAADWADKKKIPDTWYIEFSMNIVNPRPRKPPPDWTEDFTSGMVGRLSELFGMVV